MVVGVKRMVGTLGEVDRLSAEDARILALESATIRGHTLKIAIVDRHLRAAEVREHLARRLGRARRLRQRLLPTPLGLAGPVWVDDASFALSDHVRERPAADSPLDSVAFGRIVGTLMAEPLDTRKPLWTLDVVGPLEGGATALVWKLHHCMADGITALRMGSSLLWDSEPEAALDEEAPWRPAAVPGAPSLLALAARDRARGAVSAAHAVAAGLASPRAWRQGARGAASIPATLARELGPWGSPSPLDQTAGTTREAAFVAAELAAVKRVAKSAEAGTTVNDVVLALVAGGLRRWLAHRGAGLSGLRVKVPVSLHHHDPRPDALGNHDSFMFVDLPLAEVDPAHRLNLISRETRERKRHHDAEALDAFIRDLSRVSHSLGRLASRWSMDPHVFTLNVSNVPGPAGPLWIMGSPVRALHSLAEIADRHALRVSVISASGGLSFGLCADPTVVNELPILAAGIEHELEALQSPTTARDL